MSPEKALGGVPEFPESAVRGLPVISWAIDASGVFTRSTGAGLRRLGLADGDAVGQNALLAFPLAAHHLRRALRGETVQWEAHGHSDAGAWTFEAVAVPAPGGGAVGMSIDVTERIRAEERYRDLVEALPDILVATDFDGRLTALNAAFESVTGLERADWIGERLLPLVHPDDVLTVQRVLVRVGRGEEPPLFDVRIRRQDDSFVQLECRVRPQRVGGRIVGAQGIARDVTESRRLEADLRHSQRLDSIGKLAGGIAHDFNNLLLVISGHAALLSEDLAEGSEHHDHAAAIARSAERAGDLTRRLLAFSRKQVLEAVEIEVDAAVRETASMLARLIGADVQVEIDCGAPDARVVADPAQLEQVLVNLGVNARDALEPGGTLRFRTRTARLGRRRAAALDVPEGKYVEIAVEDTGCGMNPATVERIFDPFFTTKEFGRGTGLGLATVYGIVRQSGGCIGVESAVGDGTRFEIHLPLTSPGVHTSRGATQRAKPSDGGGRTGRVLLAEDDADVREFVTEILTAAGIDVVSASDGGAALDVLATDVRFDALISDVVMPHIGGFELLAQVRERLPTLPVLFVSGYADGTDADARLADADDFLAKPFLPDDLVTRVRRLLLGRPTA